jgi:hypothetical protein
VLPPLQTGRAPTIDAADVCDAVFETLSAPPQERQARIPSPSVQTEASFHGLGLLKQNAGAHAASGSAQAGITPGFAAFTILSALAVFWLCGGHALLY